VRTDYTILALAFLAAFLIGFIAGVLATSVVAVAGRRNREQARFE
jgi:hypothetical protein